MLDAVISPNGDTLKVTIDGDQAVDLHAFWLRDSCCCAACRRPSTNERLFDSGSIGDGLLLRRSVIDGPTLLLDTSDGHAIRIDVEWLRQHVARDDTIDERFNTTRLWRRADSFEIECFDRDDLGDPEGVVAWIDAVRRDGAALVRDVTADEGGLHSMAAAIGSIRATNYGVTWEVNATIEPVSAVESERSLSVHTDLPYRADPPGVQLLLSVVADVDGGASTLVDGHAAAEDLRAVDPAAWELLTRTDFTFPYRRDTVELHGKAPLIGISEHGACGTIRRAPDLVGVPIVSAKETPALYRALRRWNELLDDPVRAWQRRLEPGELLAFDNHRLLHGRTAFELGSSGERRLLGCYLDADGLVSRRAVAARSL